MVNFHWHTNLFKTGNHFKISKGTRVLDYGGLVNNVDLGTYYKIL
jgi:hypothetical protein